MTDPKVPAKDAEPDESEAEEKVPFKGGESEDEGKGSKGGEADEK